MTIGKKTLREEQFGPDPIAEAMKPRLEEDAQALFDKLNGMLEAVPVEFRFVEDMYHDEGEGPTYTIVKLTHYPDLPEPGREQVVAGYGIGEIRKYVLAMIEAMRVAEEFFVARTFGDEMSEAARLELEREVGYGGTL